MKIYYWINKEYGHLIPETHLMKDAKELGLDDITDPTSIEYGHFTLYYERTNDVAKEIPFPESPVSFSEWE